MKRKINLIACFAYNFNWQPSFFVTDGFEDYLCVLWKVTTFIFSMILCATSPECLFGLFVNTKKVTLVCSLQASSWHQWKIGCFHPACGKRIQVTLGCFFCSESVLGAAIIGDIKCVAQSGQWRPLLLASLSCDITATAAREREEKSNYNNCWGCRPPF